MIELTEITDFPKQRLIVVLENNETFELILEYSENTEAWYMDVIYGELQIKGKKVTKHPNLLRQFRNNIPFGIGIDEEPYFLKDFLEKRVTFNILNEEEVELIEQGLYENQ